MDFYAGVPDSLLKNICAYITDNLPAEQNIIAANEGVLWASQPVITWQPVRYL